MGKPRASLQARQCHTLLTLILSFLVLVGHLWFFLSLEKEHLSNAFVGVDLGGEWRGVGDLQRDESLPLGLERRDVGDYPTPRIGGFPDGDGHDVAWNSEILNRSGESKRIRRHDADVALEFNEGLRIEILGVDD